MILRAAWGQILPSFYGVKSGRIFPHFKRTDYRQFTVYDRGKYRSVDIPDYEEITGKITW